MPFKTNLNGTTKVIVVKYNIIIFCSNHSVTTEGKKLALHVANPS